MSGGEDGGQNAPTIVDDRLPLDSARGDEEGGGVSVVEGAEEARSASASSAEDGGPADRVDVVAEGSEDAAGRVFVQGGVAEEEGVRSSGEEVTGPDVLPDGDVPGGVDPRTEDEGVSGAEPGERAVADDAAKFSDDGARKVESGTSAIDQLVVASGISADTSEEITVAKVEPVESSTPLLYNPPWEESEASEARDTWMNGFEVGDMVWGKVKSHPWWPGHIFNEAFATSSVRRTKREGHVLVAFFGDSSYGWFDPAELIPFEPHYAEKSRQTVSRTFMKAVEEAVDEASRRSALGVSCQCRNPLNFRPTSVPGYFAVDVPGYEPGGVYSSKRIREARDNFVPADILSFVNQVAGTPLDPEVGSIDGIKKIAILLATRRAMFQEFDNTYAEAFGGQSSRNTHGVQGGLEQPGRAPSRAAPLSGPMVIAEPLGERRVAAPPKAPATAAAAAAAVKKNKYLFKRREEPPPAVAAAATATDTAFSPNVHFIPDGIGAAAAAAAPGAAASYPSEVGDYVLQKRASPPLQSLPAEETSKPPAQGDPRPALGGALVAEEQSPPVAGGADVKPRQLPKEEDEKAGVANQRIMMPTMSQKERPLKSEGGAAAEKKRKRKREAAGAGQPPLTPKKIREPNGGGVGVTGSSEVNAGGARVAPPPPALRVDFPAVDVEMPAVLSDLTSLAVDPFHGTDRSAAAVVRRVFLLFRSLVFEKALPVPPPREGGATTTAAAAGEQREPPPPQAKPTRKAPPPFKRDDPTKAGRKRMPSDRQEEKLAKRTKKLDSVKKALTSSEKKQQEAAPAPAKKQQQEAAPGPAPAAKPSKAEQKAAVPTFLVMKFPQRTTLPSISSLKARFARFGPLDLSGTRVFWKSYTCKVLFKRRADAQAALSYAQSNEIYGQVKVSYSLRDPDLPAGDGGGAAELGKRRDDGSSALFPTGVDLRPAAAAAAAAKQGQLKSILKKPSDEAGGAAKETQRVKFLLGGGDGTGEPPVVVCSAAAGLDNNPNRKASSSSSKSVTFLPAPQPPPPPRPAAPPVVDISGPMLSLLARCSDIVTDVKSALGYVPYHPL